MNRSETDLDCQRFSPGADDLVALAAMLKQVYVQQMPSILLKYSIINVLLVKTTIGVQIYQAVARCCFPAVTLPPGTGYRAVT